MNSSWPQGQHHVPRVLVVTVGVGRGRILLLFLANFLDELYVAIGEDQHKKRGGNVHTNGLAKFIIPTTVSEKNLKLINSFRFNFEITWWFQWKRQFSFRKIVSDF